SGGHPEDRRHARRPGGPACGGGPEGAVRLPRPVAALRRALPGAAQRRPARPARHRHVARELRRRLAGHGHQAQPQARAPGPRRGGGPRAARRRRGRVKPAPRPTAEAGRGAGPRAPHSPATTVGVKPAPAGTSNICLPPGVRTTSKAGEPSKVRTFLSCFWLRLRSLPYWFSDSPDSTSRPRMKLPVVLVTTTCRNFLPLCITLVTVTVTRFCGG